MKTNLVLIQPAVGDMDQFRDKPTPPLGLLCAASLVCRDMEVRLVDQRTGGNWRSLLASALDARTAAVGVTAMTGSMIMGALEAAREVRRLSAAPIIWGGVHASLLPEQTVSHELADYAIEGEGETALAELARRLAAGADTAGIPGVWRKVNGRAQGAPRAPLLDLNALPPVPYHLADMEKYAQTWRGKRMFFYQSSRGCPCSCAYCYNRSFNGGRWRALTAKRIIEDLSALKERYGFSLVYFLDDNFFIDQSRAMEILAGLKTLGLGSVLQGVDIETLDRLTDADLDFIEAAGVERVTIGLESGVDRVRSAVLKKSGDLELARRQLARFKGRKIIIFSSLIVGLPSETRGEADATIKFAMETLGMGANFRMPQLYNFSPYPGTELFELMKKAGETFPEKLEGWGNYEWDNSRLRQSLPETADFLERVTFLSKFLDAKLDDYSSAGTCLRALYNMYRPVAWARLRGGFLRPLPERRVYRALKKLMC